MLVCAESSIRHIIGGLMHDDIPEPHDEPLPADEPEPLPAPRHPVAIGSAVWVALFLLTAYLGHGLSAGPRDLPTGMQWTNPFEVAYSSYDILRGGERLILEANPRSHLPELALWTLLMVISGSYAWWGLRRRVRNKHGNRARPQVQRLALLLGAGVFAAAALLGPVIYLRGERLDLDPAGDQVMYQGQVIARFQDVLDFETYSRYHARGMWKSNTSYAMVMYLRGAPALTLAGDRQDLSTLPQYLNTYLHSVRAAGVPHQ